MIIEAIHKMGFIVFSCHTGQNLLNTLLIKLCNDISAKCISVDAVYDRIRNPFVLACLSTYSKSNSSWQALTASIADIHAHITAELDKQDIAGLS